MSFWRRCDVCTWSAGITGHVKLDDNLDRLGEYSLWHKPTVTANYQPFVEIKMESSHIDDIVKHAHRQTHTSCVNTYALTTLLILCSYIKCINLFTIFNASGQYCDVVNNKILVIQLFINGEK